MKKAITVFSIVLAISSLSQAAELCGLLGSHVVGPQCTVGLPCPHNMRLVYDLESQGEKIDLQTAKSEVLKEFAMDVGTNVCVQGEATTDGKFEVNSIQPE